MVDDVDTTVTEVTSLHKEPSMFPRAQDPSPREAASHWGLGCSHPWSPQPQFSFPNRVSFYQCLWAAGGIRNTHGGAGALPSQCQQASFLCSSSQKLGTLESPVCPETSRHVIGCLTLSPVHQENAFLSHGEGGPTGAGRLAHRQPHRQPLRGVYQLSEAPGSLRATYAG